MLLDWLGFEGYEHAFILLVIETANWMVAFCLTLCISRGVRALACCKSFEGSIFLNVTFSS